MRTGILLLGWLCALSIAPLPAVAEDVIDVVDSPEWDSAYDRYFQKYSKRYFGPYFDWRWFKAQAIAESRLNPGARSEAGAVGLMQLLPATFEEIKRENPHFASIDEPRWNIAAGIYYDRMLFRKWSLPSEQDRLYLAFASYNAGYLRMRRAVLAVDTAVESWEQIKRHAPPQTRYYVRQIRKLMDLESRPDRLSEKGLSGMLDDDDV